MLPDSLVCNQCQETYSFPWRSGLNCYAANVLDIDGESAVRDIDMLPMAQKPVWCRRCEGPSYAEDLRDLRDYEQASAALKSGKAIEFPFASEFCDAATAAEIFSRHLALRLARGGPGLCVVCAGTDYVELGAHGPVLRHEPCDYGVLEPRFHIGSVNDRGNVHRLFDGQGRRIGRLGHWNETAHAWMILPHSDDDPDQERIQRAKGKPVRD